MLILGIETSCDETSAAVVEDGRLVRSCVIASSRKDFESIGGVIPELAARRQLESILPVIEESLRIAGCSSGELDAIAVTHAPGLLGSLLVGTTTARVLAMTWSKPLIPVHHTLGHLSSTWLSDDQRSAVSDQLKANSQLPIASSHNFQFPIIALSVSGGHSDLWLRTSHTKNQLLGSTLDDAAGEAFDKGASLLGLPYPGGPALAERAEGGDDSRFPFPVMLAHDTSLNVSFSGLKTSLKYLLRDLEQAGTTLTEQMTSDIAAGYQKAICNHLIRRLRQAIDLHPEIKEIHVVGGVAANTRLREMAGALASDHDIIVRFPATIRYCTDNGAMIAAAGTFLWQEQASIAGRKFVTLASILAA